MSETESLDAAFHLAELENGLDVLASALRVPLATTTSDSFNMEEAPLGTQGRVGGCRSAKTGVNKSFKKSPARRQPK